MSLSQEQKVQIEEKIKKFSSIHKKMDEFEKYLAKVQEEHKAIIKELEEIRDEEKKMVESFNLDDEGRKEYQDFVMSFLGNSGKVNSKV